MGLRSRTIAAGPGWRVNDFVCTAGPHDRPFEEQYDAVCIAAVTEGSFYYRSRQGTALLAPGALLLGNAGECFECGHAHSAGDRCLAFHFEPALWEEIAAAAPGVRCASFSVPRLPPAERLAPLLATAEAARDDGDPAEIEEVALSLAAMVVVMAAGGRSTRPPSRRDQRRITEGLRRIEAAAEEPISLAELASGAATSPFHFLRVFRQVVGMTPHQYLLRTRLHRAAMQLRRSDDAISAIAFEAGFEDLSTFNRRFRRVMGTSPSLYRTRRA